MSAGLRGQCQEEHCRWVSFGQSSEVRSDGLVQRVVEGISVRIHAEHHVLKKRLVAFLLKGHRGTHGPLR
jgi:hypothetical protein